MMVTGAGGADGGHLPDGFAPVCPSPSVASDSSARKKKKADPTEARKVVQERKKKASAYAVPDDDEESLPTPKRRDDKVPTFESIASPSPSCQSGSTRDDGPGVEVCPTRSLSLNSTASVSSIASSILLDVERREILRATTPKKLLSGFGRPIWASKKTRFHGYELSVFLGMFLNRSKFGRADTWGTWSSEADGFDEFLSHSWSCSPTLKILTLLWFYNSTSAVICSLLAAIAFCILRLRLTLPPWLSGTTTLGHMDGTNRDSIFSLLCTLGWWSKNTR
eukprot:gnl/TRDRNA2_/TRDRNA2_133901_c0_seq1.p1 gnl/TRDRNA2_/TRDRNA2_133901_c0~~gnl/TRDRNA2_/TRDRNA2_133901_c0_seq1.p1  ORF type:complete len:279 (+),score=36.90 gnl/TRDRNA2_/TRDRNA2_133901_c0_seq1:66-902(+)